jgi:hypothetical protein
MSVEKLIKNLTGGALDADEFNSQLESEAEAAREAAPQDREAITIPIPPAATSSEVELSQDAKRELQESRERIKKTADKARHI